MYHEVPLHKADCPYIAFEAGGQLYNFSKDVVWGITNEVVEFQKIVDVIIRKESPKPISGVGKLFGVRATSLGYELSKGCIF